MKKRGSLKVTITCIIITVAVFTAVVIEGFTMYNTIKNNDSQVESYKTEMLADVQDGSEVVQNAGNTFNDIVEMVHEISEESSRMQQIVGKLSTGTSTIADDIDKIEDMSSNVAEETESVSAASQQQTATSHEIAVASDKLAETAQELQSFVVQFEI